MAKEVQVAEVIGVSTQSPLFKRLWEEREDFLRAYFTDEISPEKAKLAVGLLIGLLVQGILQAQFAGKPEPEKEENTGE